ncbi:MAG TPA: hypothetical protein VHC97_10700 [Thermoanaerobaculia bacterium]|jgi:hypothetical protein|nr:hypothetical protein [Thermoanaerobaculia bacterium]
MPEITAYAKIFRDWEGLIGSCQQHASLVPGVESLRTELEAVLAQAREAKVLQESLTGSRQATTQRLKEMVADGRELARKIRFFVRVPLGSRSELLSAFGITPTRSKLRQTRPIEVLPPAAKVGVPASPEVPKAGSSEGRAE